MNKLAVTTFRTLKIINEKSRRILLTTREHRYRTNIDRKHRKSPEDQMPRRNTAWRKRQTGEGHGDSGAESGQSRSGDGDIAGDW